MMTRGRRANSSACRSATSPIRSSDPQSEITTQVIRRGGVRIGPEPLDAVEEVVQRRDRVGAHRIGERAVRLDEPDDTERGPERVRVGVLVADRQHAPGPAKAIDDGLRDGVEVGPEVDRHRVDLRGA